MISSISGVLIHRGTEVLSTQLHARQNPLIQEWIGIALVFLTVLGFSLALLWVDYTCNHVIATLAAVEDSNPTSYIRLDSRNRNSADPRHPNDDPELSTASTAQPITSNLRSAIKYLHVRGGLGLFSTFRGFRMYLAWIWVDAGVALLIPAFLPIPVQTTLVSILTEFILTMFLATWQMAWIHVVIADKSPRCTYRRMLGYRHWPQIAPAAALNNSLICLTHSLNIAAVRFAVWTAIRLTATKHESEPSEGEGRGEFAGFFTSILAAMFFLLLSLPARAVFARVAASMLPEGLDPIVPFDRQFGGKVQPGSEPLSIKDAWSTFEWEARVRYVKIVLQALAVEFTLAVVGGLFLLGELNWLLFSH